MENLEQLSFKEAKKAKKNLLIEYRKILAKQSGFRAKCEKELKEKCPKLSYDKIKMFLSKHPDFIKYNNQYVLQLDVYYKYFEALDIVICKEMAENLEKYFPFLKK